MPGTRRLITASMWWRSAIASLLVGGLLFLINHDWSTLLTPWTGAIWRQLGFSMLVPFVVSLTSAVLTRREFLSASDPAPRSTPTAVPGR